MVPFILYLMTYSFEKLIALLNSKLWAYTTLLVLLSSLMMSGCSPAPESVTQSQGNANVNANTAVTKFNDVNITFFPYFQGVPIQCDQALIINNEQWHMSELAMFFSQFSLNNLNPIILDDNDWQSQQIALIRYAVDCKRAMENMSVVGIIEGNEDQALQQSLTRVIANIDSNNPSILSFNVGVPFSVNHQNPLIQASPLNDSSMFWVWRNGYKFIRWDMQNDTGDSWSFHLGSVGCESAAMVRAPQKPCAQPNFIPIEIMLSADSIQVFDMPQDSGSTHSGGAMKKIQINISIHLDEIIKNIMPSKKASCMFSGIDNTTCNKLVKNLRSNAVFK